MLNVVDVEIEIRKHVLLCPSGCGLQPPVVLLLGKVVQMGVLPQMKELVGGDRFERVRWIVISDSEELGAVVGIARHSCTVRQIKHEDAYGKGRLYPSACEVVSVLFLCLLQVGAQPLDIVRFGGLWLPFEAY